MLYNAKNETIKIDNYTTDYVSFGKGSKNLILIPGGGDGMRTVKGLAIPMASMYKMFANEYKVYIPSRRNEIKDGFSIKDMADDVVKLLEKLNIEKADIIGVSQGGMIAQQIAINHPEKVNKLVLAVTSSRANDLIKESVGGWVELAEKDNYKEIFIDTAERSYTEKKLKKYRKMYRIMSILTKPKSINRFIIQMKAILEHNVYDELSKIQAETLIIGAKKDKIVGVDASKELNEKIENSQLYVYDEYSHGVYEEAKDFNDRILEFLNK